MEWQRLTGYGRRALAETAMGRWKHLIGPKLRAHTLSGQQGKVALAVSVLNRMARTGVSGSTLTTSLVITSAAVSIVSAFSICRGKRHAASR
jgi:hypothetical protein